ncbi:hypothetical protein J4Q44_G00366570 [Coregonus suidteri]|uniref:2-(3-amino-3-carboxypropyl)histidine synthase subunit 2 n=1 Tax=Coregonus suidteri TaxID=861788 RepID=A0AAN8KV43_9TELE
MTMTEAFSSNSELVLQRVLDVTAENNVHSGNLEELCQIVETCHFINDHQFKNVALQFLDEVLVDSIPIDAEIEKGTKAKLFILGDTSYGSCCVDEVAAEHVGADCIVHYGSACLSPSRRLPLIHVILLYDVIYAHVIDYLLALLSSEYLNSAASTLHVDGELCYSHRQRHRQHNDSSSPCQNGDQVVYQFGRQFFLKCGQTVKDYSVFFIGHEGATLTNFMMTWNRCSFYSFDPVTMTGRTESISINKALMKRYYAIESVVSILVGTLGVANYLTIIEQLKETIHRAGKKSYMFAMGKLNVAKLANFLEIDIYVLIACPENSLLDSSEFYKPVVTPFEMEVACNKNREWSGEYVTDFRALLPGGSKHVALVIPDDLEDGDETDVSLITGALRTTRFSCSEPVSSSLVLRNKTLTVADANTAATFLAGRSWQGLQQKLGETPVVKALEGRKGIAIAYEEEPMTDRDHSS